MTGHDTEHKGIIMTITEDADMDPNHTSSPPSPSALKAPPREWRSPAAIGCCPCCSCC